MNNFVRGAAGVLAALIAAILVVPSLIDWNGYRGEFTAKAAQILGRPVEIRGDVGVALLPVPKVSVAGAFLGNAEGAVEADMLSIDTLEVRLAWVPLLVGRVRVESVKLVRPVLNVEISDSGESNLTLKPRGDGTATTSPAPALPVQGMRVTPKIGGGVDIGIENFVVEHGIITYRNAIRGLDERVDGLSGQVSFASLKGPVDASIRATIHGLPIAIEVSAGEIIQGRTVPFNLDATVVPGGLKAQFAGTLTGLDEAALRLRGRLTAEGLNLADFSGALGVRDVPESLRRPFGIQTNIVASGEGAELADLTLKLDGLQMHGRVGAIFTEKTTIDASLTAARLDFDSFLKSTAESKPDPRAKAPAANLQRATSPDPTNADGARAIAHNLSLESVPANMVANLAINIDALLWRGAPIRQSRVDLSLANREVTISQLSALLPGNSDVAVFGFVTEKDNLPQFDGTLELTSSDLRGALNWLGVPTKGIAGDRLRAASFNARLSARPDQASATELRARFDATQIDGALTARLASRPSFGANLTVDRVNLDAYVSDEEPAPVSEPAKPAAASAPAGAQSASAQTSPMNLLSALGAFDANLRARIGAATFKNVPLNDVRIEAALADGNLDIRSASIGDMAGVSASASGNIGGLGIAEPGVRDLVIDAKAKSLANFLRAAEIKSPISAEAFGAVGATLRLNGPIKMLEVASDIQAIGGRSSLAGRIDTRQLLPRVDGRIQLVYPDAARFVRALGVDWRPRGAKGGIDLAGNLSGTVFEIGVQDLAGSFAGVTLSGAGASRLPLLGRKMLVALNLKTGELDLDSFLPVKRVAALNIAPSDRNATVQKASFRISAPAPQGSIVKAAARDAVWSSEPFDLSALGLIDGSFSVRSDSLRFGGVSIANADLDAELQNGLLEIRHFTGRTFGGNLTIDGGLAVDSTGGKFEARYVIADADVGAADKAFGAKGATRGSATLEGRLRGGGRNMAELIASLGGEGALAFKGIDSSDGQGSILAAVGGIAQSLERLGGLRGKLEPVAINLSGPYRIESGVINFDELAFSSPVGDGGLRGRADLPRWQISANGEIRLAKEFVIGNAAAKPVPFGLDGALDAPRLRLDIAALPGGGIQIPLDKLTTKKGATEVLKSFVPNRAPKRESPTIEALPPPGAAPPTANTEKAEPKGDAKADVKAEPSAASKAEAKTDFRVAPKGTAKSEPQRETPAEAKKGERVEDILKDILRGTSR